MTEELDPLLSRLFEADAAPVADLLQRPGAREDCEAFERLVGARIRNARRRYRIRYAFAGIACALLAALLAPYVTRESVALGESATDWVAVFGQGLVSLGGWSGSLVLAGLWLLRRRLVRRVASSWRPGSRGSVRGK